MNESSSIAVTGASGMVGTALTERLESAGRQVIRLKRGTRQTDGPDVVWDPLEQGICDPQRIAGTQAIVHLAGDNIAAGRWTAAKKKRIYSSRVDATRNLVRSLKDLESRPSTLVCASAIGIYGDRGAEELTEGSAPGTGFLADVCRDWEAAACEAESLGMRVVRVRIGVVLSTLGGALTKMLTPFRLCAGGNVGDGKQYWSWIGLPDLVGVLEEAVGNDSLSGPVNAVSPQAVTNREFTKVLGGVLRRPTVIPMPAFMARLALGEMADELLLSSARVVPQVLNNAGFEFQFSDLESCLRHELG